MDGSKYCSRITLGHTPTLRRVRNDIRSIHTVVPASTTAAAITAFGTGALGATNMVGFSAAYGGGVSESSRHGRGLTEWQPTPTYFERPPQQTSSVISPASVSPVPTTRRAGRATCPQSRSATA